MFALDLDIPLSGDDLLAELGLDPRAVHDDIEDDRARRCPDRQAVFPERRFADLPIESPFRRLRHEAALAQRF